DGNPEPDAEDDRDREAERDPLEAGHDVLAELREEPHVPELDEDRRQARELRRAQMDRVCLPRGEDGERHRDLQPDLERAVARRHVPATLCDGCQRRARFSTIENAMWMATPRKPVASASA